MKNIVNNVNLTEPVKKSGTLIDSDKISNVDLLEKIEDHKTLESNPKVGQLLSE